jgi:hypothetical protein
MHDDLAEFGRAGADTNRSQTAVIRNKLENARTAQQQRCVVRNTQHNISRVTSQLCGTNELRVDAVPGAYLAG